MIKIIYKFKKCEPLASSCPFLLSKEAVKRPPLLNPADGDLNSLITYSHTEIGVVLIGKTMSRGNEPAL